MSYIPNIANPPGWTAGDAITTQFLDNFETIYDDSSEYLTTHHHDTLYHTKAEMESTYIYAGNAGHGSGVDADLIYKSSGNLHQSDLGESVGSNIGLIILWYDTIGNIPSGWHLADGTNGTRNLVGKIPICAGPNFPLGTTGGSTTFTPSGGISITGHVLTEAEMGSHRHPFTDYYAPPSGQYGVYHYLAGAPIIRAPNDTYTNETGGGQPHGHSTQEGSHFDGNAIPSMPPYRAVYYIQKIN
jgi:hypothetical protein